MTSQPAGFELRDHTADVLLVARGRDWAELFNHAGQGLMACIGELCSDWADQPPQIMELAADDLANLLHDWLTELLFGFEVRRRVFHEAWFDYLEATRLSARVRTGRLRGGASRLRREVKAVTYHQLRVEPSQVGWQATVLLDI